MVTTVLQCLVFPHRRLKLKLCDKYAAVTAAKYRLQAGETRAGQG